MKLLSREFLLYLTAVVAGIVAMLRPSGPVGQIAGAVVAALGSMGYGHQRTKQKLGTPLQWDSSPVVLTAKQKNPSNPDAK